MKPLLFKIHAQHPADGERATSDDTLGRGMDMALTLLLFMLIGWGLDRWLGLFPLCTIVLVVVASIGTFIRLKYTYDTAMRQLEAERAGRAGRTSGADAGRELGGSA